MTEKVLLLVEENGDIRMASVDAGINLGMIAQEEGLKKVRVERGEFEGQILNNLDEYEYDFDKGRIVKRKKN
ncbi:hypothetical protein [Acetohalobium arabaticum]|uniref:Uncharacterized protein n=1 Tax=Acetohalobium arabaticum (strain ATCC 49924 / DSM 5501 / Z-7288) TaxID=574087 RepID=D9QT34_ACEAZ|nr:hypothetical protein [Acetohalobium arabaticum]ADL13534.1 hypothetical protein Acear_2044 [Acetohalobium arabaticum DSM 5501]